MKIHQATVDDIPKKVIPQTVLDSNGLPMHGDFQTDGVQIIQVSMGIKPVLITEKVKEYNNNYVYNIHGKYIKDIPKVIVKKYIKNLLYVDFDDMNIVFCEDTIQDAFIFSILEDEAIKYTKNLKIFHVLYGYLLGYSKDDIMAWFMTGPIGEYIEKYHKDYILKYKFSHTAYLNNKEYYDKLEPIKKISVTFPVEFEKIWKESMKELRRLRKIPISEEFKKSVNKVTIG